MQHYVMMRPVDVIGKSGTGNVAYVTEYDNGYCLLIWNNSSSDVSAVYKSIAVLEGIHCHTGTSLDKITPQLYDKFVPKSIQFNAIQNLANVTNSFLADQAMMISINSICDAVGKIADIVSKYEPEKKSNE